MKTIIKKPIEDIFSKKKPKKTSQKKQEQKQKIIIDYREKNSLVPSQLQKLDFDIEFKELKVADYIVRETAIERKTIQDFISSMINKRLLKQLEELQQYKKRLLIIEGFEEHELYEIEDSSKGLNPNAIRGFILSILLKYNVPIAYTKNPEDTAKFISVLSKKQDKEVSFQAKKRNLNKKEQLQFIVESFPGIGPKTAKKLLEKFGSIKNIILADEESLKEILGKKAEIVKDIIDREY